MPRYIAIPKNRPDAAALAETPGGYTPKARAERIGLLHKFTSEDESLYLPKDLLKKFTEHKVIATPERNTPLTGVTIIEGGAEIVADLQNELPDHDIIEDFDFNLVAPNPAEGPPPPQDNIDRWHLEAINLGKARSGGFSGIGEGIGVAVMDTGIAEVDEIAGRIKSAYELDDDMNAIEILTKDTDGHGTGVAALIAGRTIGVAPGVDLMNFITIPQRRGTYSNFLIAAENIAQKPGISVVNISAGIIGWEPRIKPGIRALLDTYILPVVAVGNEGSDTSRSPGNYTEVLSIGAANKRGRVWSGSGSATMVPDLMRYTIPDAVAPGERVTTCNGDGEFRIFSGSSLATPIVSGIAALIIEKYPNITDLELREEIFEACEQLEGVTSARQGSGIVQIPTTLWFTGV